MLFGVPALILGYALLYTAVMNLVNGGHGPSLWQSLGIGGVSLSSPGSTSSSPTGGNQTGQPPGSNPSPVQPPTMVPGEGSVGPI